VLVIISGFFPNLFGAKFRVPGTDGQATNGGARVNSVIRDDDNMATGNVNSVIAWKKEGYQSDQTGHNYLWGLD